MFYYLLMVNKNGSLIYDRTFSNSLKLTIFYSIHVISSKLTPAGYEQTSELKLEKWGIEILQGDAMRLVCFQTFTNIKFIFVTDYQVSLDKCIENFRKVYDVYSDVVAKNPNYEIDMAIRVNK